MAYDASEVRAWARETGEPVAGRDREIASALSGFAAGKVIPLKRLA